MFKKIMIANRGEIALRIMRACRELGIKTVAIYSEADRQSLHVKSADEAICIGPARLRDSYLNIQAVLSAAGLAGADAIHPGYGFLSEDADFAEACENCRIRFIGPSPALVRLMGEKEKAREVMRRTNVPVLPGSDEVLASPHTALEIAERVGYPVILKASCGGGGRGMRMVHSPSEMDRSFQAAQSEATRSFGNGNLYMEKLLERPRHIEFQVLGDAYGHVVSLGERECSIQRRHQKLLEEAPSPVLKQELRQTIEQKVEDCLSSIGYDNAGTVEFLMDETGALYFIEMNPRIQVEHAVTEMVTGIDLVKAQIALAAGGRLPSIIPRFERQGHAIECRINAEHPETFMPSAGKIKVFQVPDGPGIRVDTAVHAEAVVSPHYDSLIAKVVAHGADRKEAISRMRRALGMLIIDGIDSSVCLHRRILEDDEFNAGQIDTKYIERLLNGKCELPGDATDVAPS